MVLKLQYSESVHSPTTSPVTTDKAVREIYLFNKQNISLHSRAFRIENRTKEENCPFYVVMPRMTIHKETRLDKESMS